MSDFNPYSEHCICGEFAQNIACTSIFHHFEQEVEEDEFQHEYEGQEHGDFVVIPIPSYQTQHADQTEGILHHTEDSEGGSTPRGEDQDMSPKQRRPCTLGDVEVILSSGPPTPTGSQRGRSVSGDYRERIEQTTEDESIEHLSEPGTPGDRTDSYSRGGERSDVLGQYRRLSSQFQFSLSLVTLEYLSQWC
jgi:hypothetical protein